MNRLIFEGRFLVNLTGSIMRQDDLRPVHGRLDWERMYRTADYHRIANIIYLGVLGNGERVPARWKNRFFERYQEALRFGDICAHAENEILTLLDMGGISCTVLESCGIRDLYHIHEIAANSPLRLYLDSESYSLAKGYLVDLGYETDRFYDGFGEHMKRVSGFEVDIYYKIPFPVLLFEKQMLYLLEHAQVRSTYQYVRTLPVEDQFLFRLAEAACHYVTDELLIRELLDIYVIYQAWQAQLNQEYIMKKLSDFHINELAGKLVQISCMWFGTKKDAVFGLLPEDMGVFDVLENRMLSRGAIMKETDTQAACLLQLIQKEQDRERHRKKLERVRKKAKECWQRFTRRLSWIFPEYKYMCAIYPVLEKIPFLLPFCWIRRDIRLLLGMFR